LKFHPGEIVRANSGREKGKYFVVLSCDDRFLYLCDGKSRKFDSPKKKNMHHVSPAGADGETVMTSITSGSSDKAIRRCISDFKLESGIR